MKLFFIAMTVLLTSASALADWAYRQEIEAMTGKKSEFADLESINSLALDFPYKGKNHGNLQIRQHPKYGQDVIFFIDKGQLLCPSYSGCEVSIKFDDKPPVRYQANGSADHNPKVIFLEAAKRFIAEASKAKRILIQTNIYQSGAPILEFSSNQPLQWGPQKSTSPAKGKDKPAPGVDWPAPGKLN